MMDTTDAVVPTTMTEINVTDESPALNQSLDLPDADFFSDWMIYFLYSVVAVMTCNCCIGVFGNIASLPVLIKQAKQYPSYLHQIFIIVLDLLGTVLLIMLMIADFGFNLWDGRGPAVIVNSAADLYGWSLLVFALGSLDNACLFLAIGISLDRLDALYRPLKYQFVNQKRRAYSNLIFSFVAGTLLSLYIIFEYYVEFSSDYGYYVLLSNDDFNNSQLGQGLLVVNLIARVSTLIMLLVLSLLVIFKYRKTLRDRKSKINPKKENGSQTGLVHENTLTLLLIGQLALLIIGTVPNIIYYVLVYLFQFDTWSVAVWTLDVLAEAGGSFKTCTNFIIYLCMSGEFRKGVKQMLFSLVGHKPAEHVSLSSTGANRGNQHPRSTKRTLDRGSVNDGSVPQSRKSNVCSRIHTISHA